jgi:hypothetical protein
MTKKYLNDIDLNGKLTIKGSAGTSGNALTTDGAGNISWASAGGSLGYVGGFQTTSTAGASANLSNINQISSPTTTAGNLNIFPQATSTLQGRLNIGGSASGAGSISLAQSQDNLYPSVFIQGMGSTAATGYPGAVFIQGGTGSGTSTLGGAVYIDGGDSINSTAGSVYIGTQTLGSGSSTTGITIGNSTSTTTFVGKVVAPGLAPAPTRSSGEYYSTFYYSASIINTGISTTTLYFVPIYFPASQSITSLGIYSTATANQVSRFGLYSNVSNKPSALLQDFGTVSVTGINLFKTSGTSYTVSPGYYWIAAQTVSSTTGASFQFGVPMYLLNSASTTGNTNVGYTQTITAGQALPTSVGTLSVMVNNAPRLYAGV